MTQFGNKQLFTIHKPSVQCAPNLDIYEFYVPANSFIDINDDFHLQPGN